VHRSTTDDCSSKLSCQAVGTSSAGPGDRRNVSWEDLLKLLHIPPLLLKVVFSLGIFALSLRLTSGRLPAPETIWSFAVSSILGAAAFLLQILLGIDGKLRRIITDQTNGANETKQHLTDHFAQINKATPLFDLLEASALKAELVNRLIRGATLVRLDSDPLLIEFTQAQLERNVKLLEELTRGARADYEGENRDWILDLTRCANVSICALNITTVRSDGQVLLDGGPWMSDLGQRYLDAQRAAQRRGVAIRRICVVEEMDVATAKTFAPVWRIQQADGIAIRVIERKAATGIVLTEALPDFVIFDEKIGYETTPAVRGGLLANTAIELRGERIHERLSRFEDLWKISKEPK